MSNELTAKYANLLQQTLNLFEEFGVREGVGKDGILMKNIRDTLATGSINVLISPTRPSGCPLCGAASLLDCDCDPAEQMAAMQQ